MSEVGANNSGFRQRLLRENKRVDQSGNFFVNGRGTVGKIPKYLCEICSYRFRYPSHLKRHLTAHAGVKNYKCDICCIALSRGDNMHTHFQQQHPQHECCSCQLCDKNFLVGSENGNASLYVTMFDDTDEFYVRDRSHSQSQDCSQSNSASRPIGNAEVCVAPNFSKLKIGVTQQASEDTGSEVDTSSSDEDQADGPKAWITTKCDIGFLHFCKFCSFKTTDTMKILDHLRHHTGQKLKD